MSLGCEAFVDITQTKDIVTEVLKASEGIGAHGVIVTAGSKAAYESAPKMLRVGGTVICVGLRKNILFSTSRAVTQETNTCLLSSTRWHRDCGS